MKHYNVAQRLIEQTIIAVAKNGLDKTTTKSIVAGSNINEAYIYSYFGNKEDLLNKTFEALDNELVDVLSKNLNVMGNAQVNYEARCRRYFNIIWRFILNGPERTLCFTRYYYSPYFSNNAADSHKARYEEFTKVFSQAFKPDANVWMLLNHILNVLLDFAIKVFDGSVPDDDDTAEHVFRLLFYSITPYIKDEIINI